MMERRTFLKMSVAPILLPCKFKLTKAQSLEEYDILTVTTELTDEYAAQVDVLDAKEATITFKKPSGKFMTVDARMHRQDSMHSNMIWADIQLDEEGVWEAQTAITIPGLLSEGEGKAETFITKTHRFEHVKEKKDKRKLWRKDALL